MSDRMNPPPPSRHRRAALLLAALIGSGWAVGQQSGQRITPNFKDADIGQIIEAVSLATGKNFIIDPRVSAKVTMLSQSSMTPEQFYQAFLSILQVHGFAAVPSGNVIKIIPDATMRQNPGNDLPSHVSPTSDELVTQIIAVKNVSAANLIPVLRPLLAQSAQFVAINGTNLIVISDRANNVARISRIIDRIDVVGNPDFDVVQLQSATAADTARTLTSLMSQAGEVGSSVKIVADDRSNSIIISGDQATRLRVRALLTHLDTPMDSAGETQVRYLRYTDAETLASHLKEQLSASNSAANSAHNTPLQPLPNAQGNTGPLPNGQPAPNGAAATGASTISLAGGTAMIWADKATNSLVITAGTRTMRALNVVIDKLDIRRPQVYVQAIIAEVTVDKTADLGVNWAIDGSATSVGVGGFISPVAGSSIVDLYNDAKNPTSAVSNPPTGTTLGIGRLKATGLNFAAMLRALQGDSRTNILATPSVVTRDNQEAKMEVAQEVPFLTGQYTTTNGTGSAFQTIQRQEVGTILTVTPIINEGGAVVLKLQVESSSLAASAQGAVDLVTNKRVITTNVLIKDGGTLVLGGLIQDSVTNAEQSVPLLGHIPLIGELFRTRNNQKTKTNFLIFLQPHILRDDEQAAIETDAKYNYIRSQQQQLGKDPTRIPLNPYQPVDPMPKMQDGKIMGGVLSPDAPTPAPAPAAPATPPAAPAATATPAASGTTP